MSGSARRQYLRRLAKRAAAHKGVSFATAWDAVIRAEIAKDVRRRRGNWFERFLTWIAERG